MAIFDMGKCDNVHDNERELNDMFDDADYKPQSKAKIGINISPEKYRELFYTDWIERLKYGKDGIEFRGNDFRP